jgi:hypothetical protein
MDMNGLLSVDRYVNIAIVKVTHFPATASASSASTSAGTSSPTYPGGRVSAASGRGSGSGSGSGSGGGGGGGSGSGTFGEGGGEVRVDLVSVLQLEWRVVLPRGEKSLSVELTGVGDEAKMGVPVGVLLLDLVLVPATGGVAPFTQVRSTIALVFPRLKWLRHCVPLLLCVAERCRSAR